MSIFGVGPVDMHDRQIIFRVCHERPFLEYRCNLIHNHDENVTGHQLDTVLSFGNHCLIA